jgi:hypothetical protein
MNLFFKKNIKNNLIIKIKKLSYLFLLLHIWGTPNLRSGHVHSNSNPIYLIACLNPCLINVIFAY